MHRRVRFIQLRSDTDGVADRYVRVPTSSAGQDSRTRSWMVFQPWLIGQGRHWYQDTAANPDNLVNVPAVRALAGRCPSEWADTEWPQWEDLAYVASRAHEHITGPEK